MPSSDRQDLLRKREFLCGLRSQEKSLQPQNPLEARGHIVQALGGFGVVELHRLEAANRWKVLGSEHVCVQRDLHRLGLGKLSFDIRRQQVPGKRAAGFQDERSDRLVRPEDVRLRTCLLGEKAVREARRPGLSRVVHRIDPDGRLALVRLDDGLGIRTIGGDGRRHLARATVGSATTVVKFVTDHQLS